MTQASIKKLTGISTRTIRDYEKEIEEVGIWSVDRTSKPRIIRFLRPPPDFGQEEEPEDGFRYRGVNNGKKAQANRKPDAPEPEKPRTNTGRRVPPNTRNTRNTSNSKAAAAELSPIREAVGTLTSLGIREDQAIKQIEDWLRGQDDPCRAARLLREWGLEESGAQNPAGAVLAAIRQGYARDKVAALEGRERQRAASQKPEVWERGPEAAWDRELEQQLRDPDPSDPEFRRLIQPLRDSPEDSFQYLTASFLVKGKYRISSAKEAVSLLEEWERERKAS